MLEFTDKGIYCPQAGIYIDPWIAVDKAVITHAHSDHTRFGCRHYLTHKLSAPILRLRLGNINVQTLEYGESININGVNLSLHPAGHIIGSAQVRLEYNGEVWVVSGDYKTENDGISEAFEPIRCDAFVTESTFGLPIFKWRPQEEIYAEINAWWKENKELGKASVLMGYPLGKSQRLLFHLDRSIGKVLAHGSVWNTNEAFIAAGVNLPRIERVTLETSKDEFAGNIILAPPSALGSPWTRKFKPYSIAHVSGWMNLRGAKRRKPVDRGFVLSDHADWDGLLSAISATGASRVYVTHGYTSAFSLYLKEQGLDASEVETLWQGEVQSETGEGVAGDKLPADESPVDTDIQSNQS